MDILALARRVAPIIFSQFKDTCDIQDMHFKNVDGVMVPDIPNSPIIASVPCAYEPLRRFAQSTELPSSDVESSDVTHRIMMKVTAESMAIRSNFILTIHARDDNPELVFEQPVRMDESLSPLLIVSVSLRNQ